jgi:hypothetical protein
MGPLKIINFNPMKKLVLLVAIILCTTFLRAQDCTLYFPSEEGSEMGYTYYSNSGKAESSSKLKITRKDLSGDKLKLDIAAETFDAKGKPALAFNYAVWCDGEYFCMDMRSALGQMNLTELEGFKIETSDLKFPAKMTPGQQLGDASIQLSLDGPMPMNMVTNITNRKVDSRESITTPAGTFDCYKITYDTFSKMSIIKNEGRVVEWYAPDVGLVRSETYNKKNKMLGYNELTSLKL